MDFSFSAEDEAFRREVRLFIAEEYPDCLKGKQRESHDISKEEFLSWYLRLAAKGWAAPAWPLEEGGPGWSPLRRYIFSEELALAGALPPMPLNIGLVGPVIYSFGTEAQKRRFLSATINLDIWWCQGFSEPGAGSDLASLQTRADRFTGENGKDYYRVNGQKTWTTLAHYADWGFFLVRTDPNAKPQAGISFLLIDLATPGVTVRRLKTIDGTSEINEIFLDDVIVPVENRIHDENAGWTCAKFLLAHERGGIAGVARSKRELARLHAIAKVEQDEGGPLFANPIFRRKLSELEIDLMALEFTELRTVATESQTPGPETSLLKIKGTDLQQRISELILEAAGPYGQADLRLEDPALTLSPPHAHRAAPVYFNLRKASIYGGSNEIQRNVIAKQILGL